MDGIQVMCLEDLVQNENDRAWLVDLANSIDATPRQGLDKDDPEGSRVIVVSDTLAKEVAKKLREIGRRKEGET